MENPVIFKPEHFKTLNIPDSAKIQLCEDINHRILPTLFKKEFSNPEEGKWVRCNDPYYTHVRYVSESYEQEPKKVELPGHINVAGCVHTFRMPEHMRGRNVKVTLEIVDGKG